MATVEAQTDGDKVTRYTQLVCDEENGIVEANQATVKVEDGGNSATIVVDRVQVNQISNRSAPAIRYSHPRTLKGLFRKCVRHCASKDDYSVPRYCWFLCGCCGIAESLILVILIPVVSLSTMCLQLGPAVSGYTVGATAFVLSCMAFARMYVKIKYKSKADKCFCWTFSILMTLLGLALIVYTVFVFLDLNYDLRFPAVDDANCNSLGLVSLVVMSIALFVWSGSYSIGIVCHERFRRRRALH